MRKYFHSLDGLRAVAVLIVLLAHAEAPYPVSGGVGVDIFFVLSGFLITRIIASEIGKSGTLDFKNFYIRRFLRLTPPMLMCLALFSVLSFLSLGSVDLNTLMICGTYVANYARGSFGADLGPMGHFWSLAVEEQFYIVWPLTVLLVERAIRSLKGKIVFFTCLATVFAIYRYLVTGHYSASRIYFGLDTHMDGLIAGSALAYLSLSLSARTDFKQSTYKTLSYVVVPFAIVGLALLMKYVTWANPLMGKYGYALAALAALAIILDITHSEYSFVKQFCSLSPLRYIGRISYGIYLYHYPIFWALKPHISELSKSTAIPLMIAISVGVAALSYHLIEVPILRLKSRFGPSIKKGAKPNSPSSKPIETMLPHPSSSV